MSLDPDAALLYLDFVEERHRIWERRQRGDAGPWTEDPILASKKFTNVFRILDPGTQFLMTDLFPGATPEEVLLRAFLYRHTGAVDAWRYLREELGEYPTVDNLFDVLACWQEYRHEYQKPVFTGAYLVYPQSSVKGTDKVESIVGLTAKLFTRENIMDFWLQAINRHEQFAILRRNKGVADFMSMQVTTDWGYSQFGADTEDEYVVCGPGARRGALALAPGWKPERTLAWAHEAVLASPGCPVLFHPDDINRSRVPSSMDTQNTLCEYSKLVRFLSGPLKAKPYVPAHPGPQPDPVLPKHW